MKGPVKKLIALTCALTMVVCALPFTTALAAEPTVGGWFESIYAELPGVTDSQVTAVSWTGTASGELTGEDLQYLVRDMSGGVRIDVPGLKAGTYTLKITANGQDTTVSGIQVLEHDRSGFAHYQYTEGVGAYNDDGTLKDKALVIYVTDQNKDTLKVTAAGGTVTGIGKVLDKSSGFLNKLAKAGIPLVVRIVGDVKTPQGVSEKKMSTDAEKQNGDNGGMLSMAGAKDVTIEGVGADATINGWGLSFACQSGQSAQGLGKSFEVRNLSFRNVPEDCINVEGVQDGDKLTSPAERIWVHNCAFYVPKIENPAAVDKAEGDGAFDFKRGQYLTMSYCYFEKYHKTNLVGGGDSNLQFNMTWHHNYWKNCESRSPLGRQANMHIYNCLYEGQSSYAMNSRANAYIFSEYNSFLNCKNPVRVEKEGGPVKSFNDKFMSCTGDRHITKVTDKTQTVESKNRYANFDTNANLSYIPSGNYKLDDSIERAEEMVKAYAGPMKAAADMVHPAGMMTAAPAVGTATPSTTPTPAPAATPAPSAQPTVTMPADVKESDWFYAAVKTVLTSGAMKGTMIGFEPNTELTIASIYQTLYNMEGANVTASGAWYAPAITWAAQQGLFKGDVASFTDATAIRGDVKTIMDAYCAQKGITATLFKGDASGNLMLDKSLTRAEWAQVLTNLGTL